MAGAGFTVLAIHAAVAVPVHLNQRVQASDLQVKTVLEAVVVAMDTCYPDNGTYRTAPTLLEICEPESEITILAAGSLGYCLGRRSARGGGSPWYLSSDDVLSQQGCV